MWSQCSSLNTGHIWSNLRLLDIILAALFWQYCSQLMWIVLLHIKGCYNNQGEMLRGINHLFCCWSVEISFPLYKDWEPVDISQTHQQRGDNRWIATDPHSKSHVHKVSYEHRNSIHFRNHQMSVTGVTASPTRPLNVTSQNRNS